MLSLTYLDRFDIEDRDAGLTEPSGLALAEDGDGLWTVSDDTGRVFRLTLDGRLVQSIDVPDTGLEGITIDPGGSFLYAVREETNEIVKLDIAGRRLVDRRRLADMDGYDAIAHFFDGDGENKGLEGIAWNADSDTLFALKEGEPGLLIEVMPDLGSIRGHTGLGAANGFVDPGPDGDGVDYSGICYDPSRALFWIVSDKARRVFLFDPRAGRAVHSAPLAFGKDGKFEEVRKAEGVAYNPEKGRLYVVSDKEVRLYVFDVRP